jgi:hypothetical protein
MMTTAIALGLALFVNSVLLVSYALLVAAEERRGERLIFAAARDALDRAAAATSAYFKAMFIYVGRHALKLSWYYSIHSILRTTLSVIVSVYDRLEGHFKRNRAKARALRAERRALLGKKDNGVLKAIALHKEAVALSPADKECLRSKALEK